MAVISQSFRTLLHTRLALGLQSYLHDTRFRGDIVVIEARETDEEFFDVNPLAFWKRQAAIQHGFESVRETLLDHADVLGPVLRRYGLDFRVPQDQAPRARRPSVERRSEERPLRVVRGGAARD